MIWRIVFHMPDAIVAKLDFGESTDTADVTSDGVTFVIRTIKSERIISSKHSFIKSIDVDKVAFF